MRSALMLLSVCGAVACEPGTCDAEEGVLLQAKSLIRKHKQTNTKDANGLLQSLQSVATSLKKGSDVSMSPDEVNAAIGTASSTLDTMFPIMADEHRLAQQSIDDAVRAVEACHDDHGSERTASLEQAVATRYSELEECDESLGQAMRAEVETCEGQGDDPNCLCTEARTAVVDQRALCTSMSTIYEMAYCEFHLLCSTFQGCHEREVAIYNDVRADVEAEMILRQQEYTTAMQAQCLLQLIIGAMTRGTPIPDDPLTACDDVSLDDLTLSFPAAPAEPECPEPPTDAPQCDEIDIVPPLACNWALPGAWQITATSHWDGNYAPDNVKVHGGNPWHTGRDNTLPQDLNFDAGQAVTLGGFATAHPTGWAGSAMQAYTLSVSNDGSSFTEVVSGTGNNLGNQERQEIDFPQVSGRYWRLHVTSNHGYGNYVTDQFIELKVCTPCEPFGWVLPSDWSVTASSQWDGNYAASNVKVHGGNPWHTGRSNTLPDNLNFDAGHEVTMSGFATAHPGGWAGSAMNNYAFSKSDDGLHYTEVHSGAGRNLAHGERQEIEFEPATARYWRLYVTSNHGYGNYVTDQYVEFKIQNECHSDDGSDGYEDFQYTASPEIQNGDFELSTISGSHAPNYFYTNDVAGWTATGGTVACRSGNSPWGGVTSEGSYYLALQGSGTSISQDVGGHVPGRTYTLRVSAAQRQNSPGGRNAFLRITVDGAELVDEVINSATFEQREFTYTAASAVATIRLENNVASGDQTIFVDSISAA